MDVIKRTLSLILIFSLFTVAINIPKIYREYTDLRKIGNAALAHGKKNGGFNDNTVNLLNGMLINNKLDGCVKDIRFMPDVNAKVQKRERFGFQLTYNAEYMVPFAGIRTRETRMEFFGYSHKYYKPYTDR